MLRSQSVVSLLLVVLIGFIVTHPVAGYNGDDYSWAVPGDNVEAGQIYIQIEPTFAPLKIEVYDGIVMTGLPDLDAVADAFGVYRLEKTYMMQETPKDPAVPDLSRYCTVYFPEEFGPVALIEAYETCPQVVLAEFVSRNKMFYVPNDPRYRNQWYLRQIDLPGAWDVTHGSSEVVIGIIDSGLDMDADGHMGFHEDFQRNIWINYGEDIDGDSLITLDDWNGEDDDENGYPDDFHGWNFSFDGNWPDDNWGADDGHGTLVAGVASADTDNETGISGAGFNCKLMITAHFDPHDPDGGIIYGYRGVEYCAANDADIINLSWGSYSETNATERAAINYALQRGTLVFAAAGNENREDDVNNRIRPYPSAYDGVIGVAASDQDDRRAEFSDYGDHVDLVAPGVGMLSTFPRNDYYTADGTSFSSPLAAGVAALLLSVEPDLNVGQVLEWMQRTAHDISEVNADYPGIQYRIDAGYLLQSSKPKYELRNWETVEIEGDQDGILERGEVIGIPMTIANLEGYADARDVTLRLESDDEYIQIYRPQVAIGDINAGEEYELWDDEYLTFFVRWVSPIHYTTFRLVINSNDDWEATFDLPMTILKPAYLLVDDDNGDRFETYYIDDLKIRPIVQDTWNITADGAPGQDYLNSYNFVIWETGNDEQPLTEAEQDLIANYLDNDGYLLLSGQYIGDDIGETDFHTNYLKARHLADDSGSPRLTGVEGNPMTAGWDVLLLGSGSAGNGRLSPSAIEPLDGAQTILTYNNYNHDPGAIYYAGDYHLVYMGFALEAVGSSGATTSRQTILETILDLFYNLDVADGVNAEIPDDFSMSVPCPNPFNPETSVRVEVPNATDFTLEVLDINGRRVDIIHRGKAPVGVQTYYWRAGGFPAGVYLLNLKWENGSLTRKVVLVK